eukprot:131771-Hanusia_phi.AAC.1
MALGIMAWVLALIYVWSNLNRERPVHPAAGARGPGPWGPGSDGPIRPGRGPGAGHGGRSSSSWKGAAAVRRLN